MHSIRLHGRISVTGEGINSEGSQPHIWNMVKLDNEWYHVDVTWDDPINRTTLDISHTFFNVTTNDIRDDHIPSSDIPDAVGTAYAYYNVLNYPVFNSQDAFNNAISLQLKAGVPVYRYCTYNFTPNLRDAVTSVNSSVESYTCYVTNRPDYSSYEVHFQYR